jgi:hypothetical protein
MERFGAGDRNAKPSNLPIPKPSNPQTICPNMPYTMDRMVCQALKFPAKNNKKP